MDGNLNDAELHRTGFLLLLFLNEGSTLVEYLFVINIRLNDKWSKLT
jgi:hypothetical protein